MVQEVGEHPQLVGGELHRDTLQADTTLAGVENQRTTTQLGRQLPTGAADERPQAGEQLLDPEGFGEVVVGSAVDALHLFVPAAARGQHQNRQGEPGFTPAAQEREAIDAGQAEVEHHGVVNLGGRQEIGLFTIGRHVDGVTLPPQGRGQLRGQGIFVFGHQDFHRAMIPRSAERHLNRG